MEVSRQIVGCRNMPFLSVLGLLCLALSPAATSPVAGGWGNHGHGGGYGSGKEGSTVVDLGYAKYEGTALSAGVTQWLGMRYVAAPLGDLRWKAPQPPKKVAGVQNATEV